MFPHYCLLLHFLLSFWQLIFIFQLPVSDDLVDSGVDGGVPTIDDISAPKKCLRMSLNPMDRFRLPPFWTRSRKIALSMVPKLSASNLKQTIIQDMKPPRKIFLSVYASFTIGSYIEASY